MRAVTNTSVKNNWRVSDGIMFAYCAEPAQSVAWNPSERHSVLLQHTSPVHCIMSICMPLEQACQQRTAFQRLLLQQLLALHVKVHTEPKLIPRLIDTCFCIACYTSLFDTPTFEIRGPLHVFLSKSLSKSAQKFDRFAVQHCSLVCSFAPWLHSTVFCFIIDYKCQTSSAVLNHDSIGFSDVWWDLQETIPGVWQD